MAHISKLRTEPKYGKVHIWKDRGQWGFNPDGLRCLLVEVHRPRIVGAVNFVSKKNREQKSVG